MMLSVEQYLQETLHLDVVKSAYTFIDVTKLEENRDLAESNY